MRDRIGAFFSIIFRSFWKWVIGGILEIIGAVLFLHPEWQDCLSWPAIRLILRWYWWVMAGAIVWAVLAVWEAAGVASTTENKRAFVSVSDTVSSFHYLALAWQKPPLFDSDPKPTLVLKSSMPVGRCYNLKKGDKVIADTEFLHVDFVNNRARKDGIPTAHEIRAYVTFFSAKKKNITHDFHGRWEGPEPEHDGPPTIGISDQDADLLEVNIPADGVSKCRLNIAVRFGDDSFAFDNDWYRTVPAEVVTLREERYFVRVQLSGENIKLSEHWFELTSNETDTTLASRRKPTRIGGWKRAPQADKTPITRKDALKPFKNAMQKPSKKKSKKKRK